MKNVHKNGKITTPVHRIKSIINPNAQPDLKNTSSYCTSCQKEYSDGYLRCHIRLYHPEVKLEKKIKKMSSTTPPICKSRNNNKRCGICDWEYCERGSYIYHMKTVHKSGNKRMNPIIVEVDAGDWNNKWCTICKRGYPSRYHYESHMDRIHKDDNKEPSAAIRNSHRINNSNPIMVEMDAGNHHNKWCTICDRVYRCRSAYVLHMNTIHKNGRREPTIRGWK